MNQFVDNNTDKKYKLILSHQEISYLLGRLDGKSGSTLRYKLHFAVEVEVQ